MNDEKKRKYLHKILDLVLDINSLDERANDVSGCLPTAFFEFSGHIGALEVNVDKTGWHSGKQHDLRLSIKTGGKFPDGEETYKDVTDVLEAFKGVKDKMMNELFNPELLSDCAYDKYSDMDLLIYVDEAGFYYENENDEVVYIGEEVEDVEKFILDYKWE